ncbi:MAG: glycosyltransferase [Lachnospiraceae bacterium]|nr:glycosyltransferase [Lachnospiraceae bacterium]
MKTVEDIEILAVDNGSQDGSMEYIEEYYPYVHTEYLGENIGFGRGCNRAVSET